MQLGIQVPAIVALFAFAMPSCGYQLATSRNKILDHRGIRTVYVAHVQNDSFKSGAEIILYNELVRMFTSSQALRLSTRMEDADVVLYSVIRKANYSAANPANASNLADVRSPYFNQTDKISGILVATQYIALLEGSFRLEQRMTPKELIAEGVRAASFKKQAALGSKPAAPNSAQVGAISAISTASGAASEPVMNNSEEAVQVEPGRVLVWQSDFSRQRPFPSNNQLGVFGTTAALINDSEFDRALRENAAAMSNDLFESMLAIF